MSKAAYQVVEKSRNVHVIQMQPKRVGWEQWFLLRSDAHHDNRHTNWDMEYKHLDQAVKRGAGILDAGDLHCAMQGKWDRRKSTDAVREEYMLGGMYLDNLVNVTAEHYKKYAKNWILMALGNHETSIFKHHETCLTTRTVERINATVKGARVYRGGYGGWVRFHFKHGTRHYAYRMKYFHGSGGGGPVTKGVIQTNRRAASTENADIIWTGHVHESWCHRDKREYLTQHDVIHHKDIYHVCSAGYKEEFRDGFAGWHVERGAPPKPNGAWWLRFYLESCKTGVEMELIEAK